MNQETPIPTGAGIAPTETPEITPNICNDDKGIETPVTNQAGTHPNCWPTPEGKI